MTLAEKILSLRTKRGMSQDDLAEKLEVSRQSVSKWETAQSTPDLDKIIRLADLFGVTVDQLVRDGEAPRTQVVCVERKWELSLVQKLGLVMEIAGVVYTIIGLIIEDWLLIWKAPPLIVLGLPLLLAKKHPWLTLCWVLMGLSFVFGPYRTEWWLPDGLAHVFRYFQLRDPGYSSYYASRDNRDLLFCGIAGIIRGLLILTLSFFTVRLCGGEWKEAWKKWREGG